MLGLPGFDLRFAELGDLGEQVDATEQHIDVLRPKHELPSRLDKAIFHRMSHPDDWIEPDDACSSLSEWAAH